MRIPTFHKMHKFKLFILLGVEIMSLLYKA
jgi:hypothetical protein